MCCFGGPSNAQVLYIPEATQVPQAQEQSSRFNGALAHPANVQTAQDLSKKDLSGLVFCRLMFFGVRERNKALVILLVTLDVVLFFLGNGHVVGNTYQNLTHRIHVLYCIFIYIWLISLW